MNKKKIVIIGIVFLAALLRLWRLSSYPAFNADEAAIGYNAYSLIKTGMDEHGNTWPIHFQSFNDFKPGLYFYLVLPFVQFMGLNIWAVRLPSALIGVATVYLLYFFVNELFSEKKIKFKVYDLGLGEIAALFLAISPWHIHFSRGGWEVNLATFLMLLGAYFFIKSKDKMIPLMFSTLSFALSLYAYHAARVVVPLFVAGLLILKVSDIKKNIRTYLIAGLVGLCAVLPLAKEFTKPEVFSRAAGVGLFADTGPLSRINEQRGEHRDYNALLPKVLHNKAVNYTLAFMQNWTAHYDGEFLFLSGDEIQRNKVPETGQMYLFDILFIFAGFYWIIRKPKTDKFKGRGWWVVLLWLFVAPTAAALTFQSPHALRAQSMVIPVVIISAFGLFRILEWVKNNIASANVGKTLYFLLFVFISWQFARYEHMYWVHLAKEYPFATQWGMKDVVKYVEENKSKYKKIIITDGYDQPYILYLFYSKYPPEKFQKEHELTARDDYGFSTVREFDKFIFRSINFDFDRPLYNNSLIIGTDKEIPDEANVVKNIYFPNGDPAFQIVAN